MAPTLRMHPGVIAATVLLASGLGAATAQAAPLFQKGQAAAFAGARHADPAVGHADRATALPLPDPGRVLDRLALARQPVDPEGLDETGDAPLSASTPPPPPLATLMTIDLRGPGHRPAPRPGPPAEIQAAEPLGPRITIPEPASLVLLVTGLVGLWARRKHLRDRAGWDSEPGQPASTPA